MPKICKKYSKKAKNAIGTRLQTVQVKYIVTMQGGMQESGRNYARKYARKVVVN